MSNKEIYINAVLYNVLHLFMKMSNVIWHLSM